MTSASPRQREVLAYITAFAAEHRCAPRIRDIMARFGFRSTNAAHSHVAALRRLGLIRKLPKFAYGAIPVTTSEQPASSLVPRRHPFSPRAARYAFTEHVTFTKAAALHGVSRDDVAAAFAELYPDHRRISV